MKSIEEGEERNSEEYMGSQNSRKKSRASNGHSRVSSKNSRDVSLSKLKSASAASANISAPNLHQPSEKKLHVLPTQNPTIEEVLDQFDEVRSQNSGKGDHAGSRVPSSQYLTEHPANKDHKSILLSSQIEIMHPEHQEDSVICDPDDQRDYAWSNPAVDPNNQGRTRPHGLLYAKEGPLATSLNLKFTSSLKANLSNSANKSALIGAPKAKVPSKKDADKESVTSSQKVSPTSRQRPLMENSVGDLLGVKNLHVQKLLTNYKNSGTFSVKKDSGAILAQDNEGSARGDYTSRTMFHVPKFITSSVGQTATMSSTLKISNTAGLKDRKGKATHRRTYSDTNSLSYHTGQRGMTSGANNFNKTSMTSRGGKLSMAIPSKQTTLKTGYIQPSKPGENVLPSNQSGSLGGSKVPPFKQINLQLKIKKDQPTCHSYREEDQLSYEHEAGSKFVTTEYLKKSVPKAANLVSQTMEANTSTESDHLRQAEEIIAQLRQENHMLKQNQELQQNVGLANFRGSRNWKVNWKSTSLWW